MNPKLTEQMIATFVHYYLMNISLKARQTLRGQ